AHLLQGQTVAVEVEHDRLVVKPAMASAAEGENADTPAKLVKKGRIQVFTGSDRPFDAVAAVEQARADREEQLLSHRKDG
ncbi:MAG TPA: hypothetical protein VD994_05255, partial [Prosthecobacter sp.]|nr:hypothetical protein [Prosthecobacter sp.]